jgi:hypothetical protein
LLAPAVEEPIGLNDQRAGVQVEDGDERSVNLTVAAGVRTLSSTPFDRAACCTSLMAFLICGLFGFTSKTITPAWGTSYDTNSSRLDIEYRGVVRVPRRVLQGLLPGQPTPERCVEAY